MGREFSLNIKAQGFALQGSPKRARAHQFLLEFQNGIGSSLQTKAAEPDSGGGKAPVEPIAFTNHNRSQTAETAAVPTRQSHLFTDKNKYS